MILSQVTQSLWRSMHVANHLSYITDVFKTVVVFFFFFFNFLLYCLVTGEVLMAIGFYSEVLKIKLHVLKEERKRKYLWCSTGFKHGELKTLPQNYQIRSDQISHSVVSDSLWPHESQHARPTCPSPTPGVHSDSRASCQWCHPAISSSVVPFSSCPQSLPASEPFSMSQLCVWGG